MATQATGSTAAGTITLVVGNVRIVGVDGVARVAKVGDKVFAREVIETGADGIIQVQLDGGRFLDVGRDSKLALSSEILAEAGAAGVPGVAPIATPPAGAEQDAAAIQKLIAAGADPSQVAAATAAGGAPAAGGAGADGGGGTPVVIDQSNATGEVTSGFPTQPAGIAFPDIEPELLPDVEAPAVSVIVQPKPGEGVTVSGNAASVIEGTQDTEGGTSDTKIVNFVITLSQVFDVDVEVTYVIQPGSALTPEDFMGELTGTVTIPAGETEFTVPVEIVMDHFVEGDQNFTIVLTDAVNATIDPNADTAVVTIINDDTAPVANPDTNWTQENSETSTTASGNVLENQPHVGAPSGSFSDKADVDIDGQEVLTVLAVEGESSNVGATLVGQYGTLVLNSDGTYTYTLNNGLPAIQRLDDGETLSESFGYTVTDGYNDPDSSTLTITIFGSNDVPTITVKTDGDIFAEAANATVDEEGLATGSNAASDSEFATGSFKVSDTDGLDDLESVTINGQTIALSDLVGATINGEHGVMTVDTFVGGVATFTYELTERTEDGAGPETDVFVLTTTDGTSTSDPATVTIDIIDDVPTARNDSNSMTEDDVSVSGNVRTNDTQGADQPALVTPGSFEGEYGTLTLNPNGSYTYTLTANLQGLDVGESVQDQFPYVLTDADGDPDNAVLTITITGSNDGPVAVADTNWVEEDSEVNSTATGNVLQNQAHPGDPSQSLSFADHRDTDVDVEPLTVTTTGVFVGEYGALTLNANGTYTYVLDNGNQDVQLLGDGQTLTDSFNYTATDGTANASSTLTITIFGTNDGPSVGRDTTRVSEEGLEGANPDNTGNTDTTNSATASGQIAVSDSDGDEQTVTLSEPLQTLTSGGETISWSGDGTKTLTGSISGEGSVDIITITIDDDGNYTVTLLGPVDHDDTASEDNVSITVGVNATDGETTGTGSLVVTIEDDSPLVNVNAIASPDALAVDETNLAANATASFADNFSATSDAGADGQESITTSYSLGVSAPGADSGLNDVATGQNIVLVMNGGVVEGHVGSGAGALAFTVSVNGAGTVTLDQIRALEHPDGTDPDDTVTLGNANLITLTQSRTITDGDGDQDTDSASINIGQALSFDDDGPQIDVTTVGSPDALAVDETNLAANATASFADNFSATSDAGADGQESITTSYSLGVSAPGADSGLNDVATGQNIVLVMNGGVVEGHVGSGAGALAFTVSVNGAGTVTLDQIRALEHPDGTDPDDTVTLGNANLITLTQSRTITDGDGDQDTDSASINIGQALSFDDDGPQIDVTTVGSPDALAVDETNLAANATASFADNFSATSDAGADGQESITTSYSLGVSAPGADSGLNDVATGQNIVLVMNGGVVEGHVGSGAGALAFTVSVNGAGTVTLDQIRALEHPDGTDPDDTVTLGNANLITLTQSRTITDGDGDQDTDSASINIGQALSFDDDGPQIDVTTVGSPDALAVDETNLAANATASFADNFSATSDAGADGQESITTSYSLGVSAPGADSGLNDVATGQNIVLVMNGGVVEGHVGSGAGALAFTVSVNGAGTVTLDQIRALEHPDGTDPDDTVTLGNANLITLTQSRTITDGDGDQDTDSASINIGQALSFDDDGPQIDVTTVGSPDALAVDETNLAANATASFADNFSATSDAGADGQESITTSYSLGVSAPGADSGLNDVATGQNIVLVMNGGVVEGHVGSGAGALAFTVSVNGAGTVTLDQIRALEHPDGTDPDDTVTLGNANLITLTQSRTITDGDGDQDTDSASINIGQALSFDDDGPQIDVTTVGSPDALAVDETNLAANATASFADNFSATSDAGADGQESITTSYSLGVSAPGADSGLNDVATGQNIVLVMNGGVVEGHVGSGAGALAFTVSVNGAGTVTLNQIRALEHPNASNPDDAVSLASANLITLTRSSTITDRDGDQDTDSASINIGQALSFKDDGPSLNAANVAIPNIAGTYTGTYTFDVGADAQNFADSFESGSLVWTNPRDGYTFEYDASASNATQQVYHGTFNGGADTFFDIVVKSDGTYTITLVTPDPVTEVDVASVLSGISGGSGLSSFTVPNSVFGGQFDLLLTGYSQGHVSDTLTISSTELGVSDNVMHGNKDDVLRFDIVPVAPDVTVSSLTIHVATTAGWKAADDVNTIVHYTTGPDTVATIEWGADQQVVLSFDTTREVDWVEITPNGDDAFKIDGVSLSYLVTEFPDNYSLDFELTGDDKDGDSVTAGFSVEVNTTDTSTYTIQGTSGSDHVYGTTGNDILVGGDGSDVLTGGLGNDTFKWNLGDGGAPAPMDTVTDFTQAPGDKLNLSELLTGEHANAGSLSAYLHFTASGGNTTVEIKSSGGGAIDHKIVLQGIDLTSGGTLNDSQIIQTLLTAGKLQTDA